MPVTCDRFPLFSLALAALAATSCQAEVGARTTLLVVEPRPGIVAEGGFSDLALDPSDSTGRTVLTISDRGPNTTRKDEAYFPHPAYHQKITRFRLDEDGSVRWIGVDSIRDGRGVWTTGLPSPFFPSSERAFHTRPDGQTVALAPDSAGFDFEGLVASDSGTLWASEEYGPRLVRLRRDSTGSYRIERSLSPGNGLPSVFARRAANKGLEALCRTPKGRIVAIFQGPLANASAKDPKEVAERSLARRMLSLDPLTGVSREYVAQMDDPPGKSKRRTKIGACVALDEDRFLVLEHRKAKQGPPRIDLVVWNISKATDIHLGDDTAKRGRLSNGLTVEEIALEPDGLSASGVRTVARKMALENLAEAIAGGDELSKPEGLVIVRGDHDLEAWIICDNDFGAKGAKSSSFFLRTRLPKAKL